MKKILIIKLGTDVTFATDAQIEALKELWRVTFAPMPGIDVSFEVLTTNEESVAERLLRMVRAEFRDLEANAANYEAYHARLKEVAETGMTKEQRELKKFLESPCEFIELAETGTDIVGDFLASGKEHDEAGDE